MFAMFKTTDCILTEGLASVKNLQGRAHRPGPFHVRSVGSQVPPLLPPPSSAAALPRREPALSKVEGTARGASRAELTEHDAALFF